MRQKCRYNIRLAEKKGVTVRASDDLPAFHDMLEVHRRTGMDSVCIRLNIISAPTTCSIPGDCVNCFVAEYGGLPLASVDGFSRTEVALGMSTAHPMTGKRNRMPAYLLQWEAIRWAKATRL